MTEIQIVGEEKSVQNTGIENYSSISIQSKNP